MSIEGSSSILRAVSLFIVKPARVLQTRFVTSKTGPDEQYSFKELLARFLPTGVSKSEASKLLGLRAGMFIGKVRSAKTPGKEVQFVLYNQDGSGNIDFVLKNDPSFESRLIEAYRVEHAEYDVTLTEAPAQGVTQ